METWYVMEDGSAGDPREIAADAKGVLIHKDGRKVAYREYGPRSIGVDPDEERAKQKPKPESPKEPKPAAEEAGKAPPSSDRQMSPESGLPYKTR